MRGLGGLSIVGDDNKWDLATLSFVGEGEWLNIFSLLMGFVTCVRFAAEVGKMHRCWDNRCYN